MVATRKVSILLALVVTAMLSSGVVQAQNQGLGLVTCTATAVPPVVRAEGIAELVGDIVLTCFATPGSAFAPAVYLQTNFSVSLNVNITNNIGFVSGGANSNITDAVLIINENNTAAPTVDPTFGGPDPRFQVPQYGRLAATQRLEWNGSYFPFPGVLEPGGDPTDPFDYFPLVSTVRISNIRGNASQLGVPDQATFPSTQITAFVSITGPTTIPVTNNVLNVAVPILGLLVDSGEAINGLQCLDTSVHVDIELEEGFATAFKTLGVPTFLPGNTQWEDGYFTPGSGINNGGATQGTRFLFRFFNIPEGVNISVPYVVLEGSANITGDALHLKLVTGTDANGAGGSITANDSGTFDLLLSGGFGYVVYEVVDDDPFATENIDVDVWFDWDADTANELPAIGSGQVAVTFAPLSTVRTANRVAPEPRFVDTGNDPATIINIVKCTTTLLFPFVTNQLGFDTGLAISNTSRDWLSTPEQTGACTIHYHGATTGGGAPPADQTSVPIGAGEQLIFTLSNGNAGQGIDGAPEFQGYIIAICQFQYGHGFAFITDGFGGIPALAQGYLALVIPTAPLSDNTTFRPAGVWHYDEEFDVLFPDPFGERLNH